MARRIVIDSGDAGGDIVIHRRKQPVPKVAYIPIYTPVTKVVPMPVPTNDKALGAIHHEVWHEEPVLEPGIEDKSAFVRGELQQDWL